MATQSEAKVEVLGHLLLRCLPHNTTTQHTHRQLENYWHSCCCCSSCENLHAHKTIFVAVSRAQQKRKATLQQCCSNIFAASQMLTLAGNEKRGNYINWSALLPKDKQTICSLATCLKSLLLFSLWRLPACQPGSNKFVCSFSRVSLV